MLHLITSLNVCRAENFWKIKTYFFDELSTGWLKCCCFDILAGQQPLWLRHHDFNPFYIKHCFINSFQTVAIH